MLTWLIVILFVQIFIRLLLLVIFILWLIIVKNLLKFLKCGAGACIPIHFWISYNGFIVPFNVEWHLSLNYSSSYYYNLILPHYPGICCHDTNPCHIGYFLTVGLNRFLCFSLYSSGYLRYVMFQTHEVKRGCTG